MLLRIYRPFYGVPKASMDWFVKYHIHHCVKLGVRAAMHETCFLYTLSCLANSPHDTQFRGITCLQTDETLSLRSAAFIAKEEKLSRKHDCKPNTKLADSK